MEKKDKNSDRQHEQSDAPFIGKQTDANAPTVEQSEQEDNRLTDTSKMIQPQSSSQPAQQSATKSETAGGDSSVTWDSVYNNLVDEQRKAYEGERKELDRRERNRQAVASVSDAARALSNIYFANKGAENIYDPRSTMSEAYQKRYERARADLDKRNAEMLAYIDKRNANSNARRNITLQEAKLQLAKEQEKRRNADLLLRTKEQAWKESSKQGDLDVKKEKNEIDRLYKEGKLTIEEHRAASEELRAQAALMNAQTRQSGTTTNEEYERDPITGNVTKKTKVTTPNQSGGQPTKKKTAELGNGKKTADL